MTNFLQVTSFDPLIVTDTNAGPQGATGQTGPQGPIGLPGLAGGAINAGNANVRAAFSYDTTANWTSANPILNQNERAVDSVALTARIGDGVTRYLSLPLEYSANYAPRSIPAGAVACYALTDGKGGVTLYDINGAVL